MKGHDCSDSSAMSALISQLIKHHWTINADPQNSGLVADDSSH